MKRIILCSILLLIFIGNAEAVEPFDTQAGMAAYVNVGPFNLENATVAYTQIYNLSTCHVVGTINIGNNIGSDNIHVYVDINGWIVAYLTRNEELGHMIQWSGVDYNNPTVKTTFEDAISKVCTKINVNYSLIQNNIKYYDFEYPQATNVIIFMNTASSSESTNLMIPGTYTIYSMNYSHFTNNNGYNYANLYLDGTLINSVYHGRRTVGSYSPTILTQDIPHTLQIVTGMIGTWTGVASILVSRQPSSVRL